jgi:hypothetical protein
MQGKGCKAQGARGMGQGAGSLGQGVKFWCYHGAMDLTLASGWLNFDICRNN